MSVEVARETALKVKRVKNVEGVPETLVILWELEAVDLRKSVTQ